MPVITISNIDDPRIEAYRNLNSVNRTSPSETFVVEGRWLVERLIQSKLPTESILLQQQHADEFLRLTKDSIPIYTLGDDDVNRIVGFKFHRGVLAIGRRPKNKLLEEMNFENPATLVVCPEIADPTNLGGIIRSCSAFGTDGLILGHRGTDPYSRRVVRVSMGSAFSLAIRVSEDLNDDLFRLREEFGFERIATVLDDKAERLQTARRSHRTALLIGSEGDGLSKEIVSLCERKVTLPMKSGTDSLNVASAASVFLYHFCSVAK